MEEGTSASNAAMIHARQFLNDSKNVTLFPNVRAHLAAISAELALKAVYYMYYPDGEIKKHISRNLMGDVCHLSGIQSDSEVVNAAGRLEPHYSASRYPEETTRTFDCVAMQVGCWHYPDVIESIVNDAETIVEWASSQLSQ